MKKLICALLTSLFLMVPMSASALPGGLLHGKPLKISWSGSSDVFSDKLTDDDPSTSENIDWNGQVVVDFGARAVDIDRWYFDGRYYMGGDLSIYFYRSGQELHSEVVGGASFYDTPLKGVDKIIIWYSGGFHGTIREFDIFGEIDVPYPNGVTVEPGTRQLKVTWKPLNVEDLSGYVVYLDGVPGPVISDTSYVFKDLTPDKKYKIEVTAMYGDVGSKRSEPVEAVPYADPLPEPRLQADAAFNDRLRLSWTDNGAVNYILSTGSRQLTEGKMTTYTHTGLKKDTEYPYLLKWVDKYGRMGSMVKTLRTTLEDPPPPPEPPTSLQARPEHKMVTLTWERSPRDDIVGYRVYQDGKPLLGKQQGSTLDVRGLENGKEYRFYVTSVSKTGEESGPSPEAKATPQSEPAPVTGINPGKIQWGFGPGDILSNGGSILLMLSSFVLLGIAIMYVKPLIVLIREAVKPR